MAKAKPRVKAPKKAEVGEVVTIKTLISHKMESGLRKGKDGNLIPRQIINKLIREEDLYEAVDAAYSQGWQRMKLYFLIGLPSETDEDTLGYIAEEVMELGLPDLVQVDDEGTIHGINYDHIPIYTLEVVKRQQKQIEQQQQEIQNLKAELRKVQRQSELGQAAMQQELDEIRALVSELLPANDER